jgi:hypothetical protein
LRARSQLEALTRALFQRETEQVQGETGKDNPSSPLPSQLSALGLLTLDLMRRSDGKGSVNAGTAMGAATAVHTDDLTAITTTLVNGTFNAGQNGAMDQWESVGNVAAAA